MSRSVAISETNASHFVAISESDRIFPTRYKFTMLSEWLRAALKETDIKQAELARQLTSRLGRSIDRAAVNKMTTGERNILGDELLEIERITGFSAPVEILVPLKGRVGAGHETEAIEFSYDETAPAPADVRPGTVAVEVEGSSMFPAYEPGSILYYSKILPPSEMVNRRAIVQLADGRAMVKIVRPGSAPNTWTLQSINARYPDIEDVVVEWAAPIEWIRPR